MAAGDKVQVGTVLKVEFAGATWAGRVLDGVTNQKTGNVDTQLDERGATMTYIITDPGTEIQVQCRISSGSITPLTVGEIATVTPPGGSATNMIILSPTPVSHSSGVTVQSATFVRKDSMASVLDA